MIDGWKTCALGEIADVMMGQSPKSEFYNFNAIGIPFLQGNRTFGSKYPSFDTYTTVVTKEAKAGDIVMSVRAPVGDLNITPVDVCLGRGVCSLRMKNGNQEFLYYLMKYYTPQLLNKESGTVFGSINKNDIVSLKVSIPLDDNLQQKIARYLTIIDDKIELNNKINKALEEMAKAIFKSWFVDFEPWGGKMPDDWREVKLGDVTNEIKLKLNDMQLPVFSAVKTGNLVLSEDYFTKKVYSKDISKYIIVEPDDFSYNPARINIGSIGMNEFDFSGCVSPVYVVFRSEPGYHHFLRFFFKSLRFREEVKIRSSGSVRQVLKYEDFSLIKLFYPPIDLVRKFNNIYKIILGIINQNNIENIHLSSLRDTLLPKLMSGEIRVK